MIFVTEAYRKQIQLLFNVSWSRQNSCLSSLRGYYCQTIKVKKFHLLLYLKLVMIVHISYFHSSVKLSMSMTRNRFEWDSKYLHATSEKNKGVNHVTLSSWDFLFLWTYFISQFSRDRQSQKYLAGKLCFPKQHFFFRWDERKTNISYGFISVNDISLALRNNIITMYNRRTIT